MNKEDSFFAENLLKRLETESPLQIAYESQARSADVGFDFTSARIAFERLADEVRELTEALAEYKEEKDTKEHLCDEATDIIFGTINVLRHAKYDMGQVFPHLTTDSVENSETELPTFFTEVVSSFEVFTKNFEVFEQDENSADVLLSSALVLMQNALDFVNAYGVSPNEVMRANVTKYLLRCQFIEKELKDEDKTWLDIPLEEIYVRWKKAKKSGL